MITCSYILNKRDSIEEEFETESGDVDENDNTFDSLDVESKGYYITKEFLDFYEMVLKRNENNG